MKEQIKTLEMKVGHLNHELENQKSNYYEYIIKTSQDERFLESVKEVTYFIYYLFIKWYNRLKNILPKRYFWWGFAKANILFNGLI